ENGANSSFVNRMADADVPVAELVTDPATELAALRPKRNPSIPLPADMYPNRRNSTGVDLADPRVREPLLAELEALKTREWAAAPTALAKPSPKGKEGIREIRSPQEHGAIVGHALDASAADVDLMLARAEAAQPAWDALGGTARAELLIRASDLFEAHTAQFIDLCQREAGKALV